MAHNHVTVHGAVADNHSVQHIIVNNIAEHNFQNEARLYQDAIRSLNPHTIKIRLMETKDKLIHEAWKWILGDPSFKRWRSCDDVAMLWIKGDAGKGKTMMVLGLIEELSREARLGNDILVGYFFCQNTDDSLNTAAAVVKGLIYSILESQPALARHLRGHWDTSNNKFRESLFSVRVLWEVFLGMLNDSVHRVVYIVVDALDECHTVDMEDLLKLIARTGLQAPSRIKWLVTSRPMPKRQRWLQQGSDQIMVSLELNADHIRKAVDVFIEAKVDQLTYMNHYSTTLRAAAVAILKSKAENTFLWVSIVCRSLEGVLKEDILITIEQLPSELFALYDRMLHLIEADSRDQALQLIQTVAIACRPLHVEELAGISGLPDSVCRDETLLSGLLTQCCSFVVMTHHDKTFHLVHQSAKDYLDTRSTTLMSPSIRVRVEIRTMTNCLDILGRILNRGMFKLTRPGSSVTDIEYSKRQEVSVKYGYVTCFWATHAARVSNQALEDGGPVDAFLHNHYLSWLKALAILGMISQGISVLKGLTEITRDMTSSQKLNSFVYDCLRYLFQTKVVAEEFPLQIDSMLLFSPGRYQRNKQLLRNLPDYVQLSPGTTSDWMPLLQALEGHTTAVRSTCFSPNGDFIAAWTWHSVVKVWDTTTGSICFSYDFSEEKDIEGTICNVRFETERYGNELLSMCLENHEDGYEYRWSVKTGILVEKLSYEVLPQALWLETRDNLNDCVKLDLENDKFIKGFTSLPLSSADARWIGWQHGRHIFVRLSEQAKGFTHIHGHAMFSKHTKILDSQDLLLTITLEDMGCVRIWDLRSGRCSNRYTLDHEIRSIGFSENSRYIACSDGYSISLMDLYQGLRYVKTFVSKLKTRSRIVGSTQPFKPTEIAICEKTMLLAASTGRSIQVWSIQNGEPFTFLKGHTQVVTAIGFSPDGRIIASASVDCTIRLWEMAYKAEPGMSVSPIRHLQFSPDGRFCVCVFSLEELELRDLTIQGVPKRLALEHIGRIRTISFSHDSNALLYGYEDDLTGDKLIAIQLCNTDQHLVLAAEDPRLNVFTVTSVICPQALDLTVLLHHSSDGSKISFLRPREGSNILELCTQITMGHSSWEIHAVSDKGKRLMIKQGRLRVWGFTIRKKLLKQRIPNRKATLKLKYCQPERLLTGVFADRYTQWELVERLPIPTASPMQWKLNSQRLTKSMPMWNIDQTTTPQSLQNNLTHAAKPNSILHSSGNASFSCDGTWVLYGDQRILWLPPDYRPLRKFVKTTDPKGVLGNMIHVIQNQVFLVVGSGELVKLTFQVDKVRAIV